MNHFFELCNFIMEIGYLWLSPQCLILHLIQFPLTHTNILFQPFVIFPQLFVLHPSILHCLNELPYFPLLFCTEVSNFQILHGLFPHRNGADSLPLRMLTLQNPRSSHIALRLPIHAPQQLRWIWEFINGTNQISSSFLAEVIKDVLLRLKLSRRVAASLVEVVELLNAEPTVQRLYHLDHILSVDYVVCTLALLA